MADDNCGICGLVAEPVLLQMCFRCDTLYHLNPYSNVEGIDCGDAIIGVELGLYYYCSPCIVAINDEINDLVMQESQQRETERQPGWRATPVADTAVSEAPAPSSASQSSKLPVTPPRAAGSPPRRRFRRIDQ